jgi:hypothetical protein
MSIPVLASRLNYPPVDDSNLQRDDFSKPTRDVGFYQRAEIEDALAHL